MIWAAWNLLPRKRTWKAVGFSWVLPLQLNSLFKLRLISFVNASPTRRRNSGLRVYPQGSKVGKVALPSAES
jgi:hypothetical protein